MWGVDKSEWLEKRNTVRNRTECRRGKKPTQVNFCGKAGPGDYPEKCRLKGS